MTLRDIMKSDVVTSSDEDTVREAALKLTNNKVDCLIAFYFDFALI